MSNENESGGGILLLIGLVLIIGLAYLSRNPLWDINPIVYLVGSIVVSFFVGISAGHDMAEEENSKLLSRKNEQGTYEQEAQVLKGELDEAKSYIKLMEKDLEKEVAKGIKIDENAALKAALAERDELQNQISSLVNQQNDATKEIQKSKTSSQKKIDNLQAQLAEEKSQTDSKYTVLETKYNSISDRFREECSRTEELIAERIHEMSSNDIVQFINERLAKIKRAELTGETQSAMIKLQSQIEVMFTNNGLVDINTLVEFDENIFRINEYEAIIDLYMEKIKTVRQKIDIEEEDREEQIISWRRLMDQEVAKMEGTA